MILCNKYVIQVHLTMAVIIILCDQKPGTPGTRIPKTEQNSLG